jgi:hypothetical protein
MPVIHIENITSVSILVDGENPPADHDGHFLSHAAECTWN